MTEWRRF